MTVLERRKLLKDLLQVYLLNGKIYDNETLNKHCFNATTRILIKTGYEAEACYIALHLSDDTIEVESQNGSNQEKQIDNNS